MKNAYVLLPGILFCITSCKTVDAVTEIPEHHVRADTVQPLIADSTKKTLAETPVDPGIYYPFGLDPYVPYNFGMYTISVVELPRTYYYWGPQNYPLRLVLCNPYPPTGGTWIVEGLPWKHWHEIDLFDTTENTPLSASIIATRAKEISTVPPAETPEPAEPATLPSQPWYEAILPKPWQIQKG